MAFKVDVDRYTKDELEYELRIRGMSEVGNSEQLRKSLRGALSLEKAGRSFHCTVKLEAENELVVCELKLAELRELISVFSGTNSQIRKIETKLNHIFGRIDRVEAEDEELIARRSTIMNQFTTLVDEYMTKQESLQRSSAAQAKAPLNPSFCEAETPAATSTPHAEHIEGTEARNYPIMSSKTIPVHKWNVKFSAKSDSLSINAFLEQVEDLRLSRNVSKEELFHSAIELFEGDALTWYRAVRKQVSSWDDLTKRMKEEFLPPMSADTLWKQILERTQGSNESIGLYVAVMTALFDRMPTTVSEPLRLQVLRRNIIPFYQERLALMDIQTSFELIELCRKLESTRMSVESYHPPRASDLTLEPDLRYSAASSEDREKSVKRPVVREMLGREEKRMCWRCNKVGHLARNCSAVIGIKCFGCGKSGVTRSSCPQCRENKDRQYKTSGNAQ